MGLFDSKELRELKDLVAKIDKHIECAEIEYNRFNVWSFEATQQVALARNLVERMSYVWNILSQRDKQKYKISSPEGIPISLEQYIPYYIKAMNDVFVEVGLEIVIFD